MPEKEKNRKEVVEQGANLNREDADEMKNLVIEIEKNLSSLIDDDSKNNLNSEGVAKENAHTSNSECVEDGDEAKSDGSQLRRIAGGGKNSDKGKTLAGESEDMKSLEHIDAIPSDKEGTDGEEESEKSSYDEEDDEGDSGDNEEETEGESEDMKSLGHIDEIPNDKEGTDGEGESEKSSYDEEDDEDKSGDGEGKTEKDEEICESIHDPLSEIKKKNATEIHVGRLAKGAVEEDLIEVFGKFGEIQSAKIVKHSITNKSKGFAYIKYATAKQAEDVLSKLKDGIEVRGKTVKISASQGNNKLYVGNICKIWTKEHVIEKLKCYGIENVVEIYLPEASNSKNEAEIRGYAHLEFTTHSDAMAAFQRLREPDVVFGRDRSAKVAFALTPQSLSQKTVCMEGLPRLWDGEILERICKQYGEIEKVKLPRRFGSKGKDFGFITFNSQESALACVEGINNSQIGGETKVKASIAKGDSRAAPHNLTLGGFKVTSVSETEDGLKMKGHTKSKGAGKGSERTEHARNDKSKGIEIKTKAVAETSHAPPKSKSRKGGKSNNSQTRVTEGRDVRMMSKSRKTNRGRKNLPSKNDGRGKSNTVHGYSKRPSKRPRGNVRDRQSYASRNPRSEPHLIKGLVHGADSIAHKVQHASGYIASTSYPGLAFVATSGSKRHWSDMEPHAGYLEPTAQKRYRQPDAGYTVSALGHQSQPQARYLEPSLGRLGLHHGGYLEPAVGKQGHDLYAHGLRSRAGGYDGQGSSGSAYGRGSPLPPSYAPNYTSYAGYQADGSSGGYYHSTRYAYR